MQKHLTQGKRKFELIAMPTNEGWDYTYQVVAIRPQAQTLQSLVDFYLNLRRTTGFSYKA